MKLPNGILWFCRISVCFLFAFILFSCQKDPVTPSGSNKVEIGILYIDSISYFNAKVSTILISTGGMSILQHGHCWSKEEIPDIDDAHTSLGSLITAKQFTSNLANLDPNVKYFIRPYVSLQNNIIYGNQEQFYTLKTGRPVIMTSIVTDITAYSAISGGNVVSDSGYVITDRGICWDTVNHFSITDCLGKVSGGNGLGIYICNISGLEEGKYYNVKAYATNETGTGYGEIKNFRALPIILPTVNTSLVTSITATSAVSGGNVTSSGNGNVTSRGVCWNTTGNPTLENNQGYTNDGPGTGLFSSILTDLTYPQQYFIQAYATNEKGTSYGQVKQFETAPPCGLLTVYYGDQTYNTILIGSQCWFTVNLNIGIRTNSIEEQLNNGIIEKYCYEDNEANCSIYGGLYQWSEMMQYVTIEESQGICPEGWHIPSDFEWSVLTDFLGGETAAGGPLKEFGTSHWNSPNTGANNSSQFSALPGGGRDVEGNTNGLGEFAHFWSSTEISFDLAWKRKLYYDRSSISRGSNIKGGGFSVRCVKND